MNQPWLLAVRPKPYEYRPLVTACIQAEDELRAEGVGFTLNALRAARQARQDGA